MNDSANEQLAKRIDDILKPWELEVVSEYGTGINDHKKRPFIEIKQAKAAILAAFTAELRAIIPKKCGSENPGGTGISPEGTGWNDAIDAMERKAGERGLL